MGSVNAHSALRMSDGYRGIRALRLIPPGQQRHGTSSVLRDRADPDGSLICTNRDHQVRASRTGGSTRGTAPSCTLESPDRFLANPGPQELPDLLGGLGCLGGAEQDLVDVGQALRRLQCVSPSY